MLLVRMTSGRPPRRRSGSRKYHPVLSVVQPETRTCSRLTSAHCTHTIASKQELVLLFRRLTFGSRSSGAPREPTAARRAATDRRYTRTTGAAATTAGAPHTAGGADTAMDEAVPLAGTARAVGDSAASGPTPPEPTVRANHAAPCAHSVTYPLEWPVLDGIGTRTRPDMDINENMFYFHARAVEPER